MYTDRRIIIKRPLSTYFAATKIIWKFKFVKSKNVTQYAVATIHLQHRVYHQQINHLQHIYIYSIYS